jgi:hypothetical protein
MIASDNVVHNEYTIIRGAQCKRRVSDLLAKLSY